MVDLKSIVCVHDHPSADAILWRYMDFAKFVSILENSALFFPRADKLDDPFEGALPKENIKKRQTNLHPEFEEAISISGFSTFASFWKQLPRFTLINCWHESTHESEAMWRLYSSKQGGIAVKTDFNSFVESFTTSEQIHIGSVKYVDYENDQIPENDPLSPYLYKRKSFEHEREVRAIIQNTPTGNIAQSQDIYDIGDFCQVDLNLLIQEVIIDPFAPDWFLTLVKSVAKRYELKVTVNKSPLAESPTW